MIGRLVNRKSTGRLAVQLDTQGGEKFDSLFSFLAKLHYELTIIKAPSDL